MCRIEFQATFRMKVGVPDLSEKSYSRKFKLLKKFKNVRSHKNKPKRQLKKVAEKISRFLLTLSEKKINASYFLTVTNPW